MASKKTALLKKFKPSFRKKSAKTKKVEQTDTQGAPRITSDTVAEHREEVLAGARRFIYPLQQSKYRVVIVSSIIVAVLFLTSLTFAGVLLYRQQSTGNFAYRISQIIPFPVTKIDGDFVSYEDYLFELRYSLFYFRNYDQEGVDINSTEGQQLVNQLKVQALEKVKLDATAKKLAKEQGVVISEQDIQKQIDVIRNQGGISQSDQVLEDILRSSYDWGIEDLERTIRSQLIRQSLPRILDTETIKKAESVLGQMAAGTSFEDLAGAHSEDLLTKENKGIIGLISRTNTDLPPEFIEAAFSLDAGETSQLVESRFGLHIIRINKVEGDEREVAHILFSYFDVEQFLKEELAKVDVVDYITIE